MVSYILLLCILALHKASSAVIWVTHTVTVSKTRSTTTTSYSALYPTTVLNYSSEDLYGEAPTNTNYFDPSAGYVTTYPTIGTDYSNTGYSYSTSGLDPNYISTIKDNIDLYTEVAKPSNYGGPAQTNSQYGNMQTDNGSYQQPNIGQLSITEKMIQDTVTSLGYPMPSSQQVKALMISLRSGEICCNTEAAMFFAQVLWESHGLTSKEEKQCLSSDCKSLYRSSDDLANNIYFGRGYIQLTWARNYLSASTSLYNDDRLLKNPDIVSRDENISWQVSFWYWKVHVKTNPDVLRGYFGASTKMINGQLECSGGDTSKAKQRYEIYKKVLQVFAPGENPIENGCYN